MLPMTVPQSWAFLALALLLACLMLSLAEQLSRKAPLVRTAATASAPFGVVGAGDTERPNLTLIVSPRRQMAGDHDQPYDWTVDGL